MVVVNAVALESVLVELKVVAFEHFVLIKREGILDGHILNILCWLRPVFLLGQVVGLRHKFVQQRNIFKLFHLDLKNVLHLSVDLSAIRVFAVTVTFLSKGLLFFLSDLFKLLLLSLGLFLRLEALLEAVLL